MHGSVLCLTLRDPSLFSTYRGYRSSSGLGVALYLSQMYQVRLWEGKYLSHSLEVRERLPVWFAKSGHFWSQDPTIITRAC